LSRAPYGVTGVVGPAAVGQQGAGPSR
jgi:hypothetical protein